LVAINPVTAATRMWQFRKRLQKCLALEIKRKLRGERGKETRSVMVCLLLSLVFNKEDER
jgi:hypothetical protein